MTALAEQAPRAAGAAALASGKGHKDENFPVASLLIRPEHRAPIMAFYRFARAADDVADHPTAPPVEKLARLEAMRAGLTGESDADPAAGALRAALAGRGLDAGHALDLLEAFRRDVTVNRYADWDALIDYCRYSAMPVGRFVLDVHGEDRALWPASDALCAALQVINHLQDCGKDYRAIDRVYLPADRLAAHGATVDMLAAPRAAPALKAAIGEAAGEAEALLARSAGFARAIADRRLGMEVAAIQRLAESLAARLRRRDPLAEKVHHGRMEALMIAGRAALGRMIARGGRA
ncbi:MAG: squalene synthase HpnC [Sphingomonas sp.]|nr:squalene synthase HpnC [Sphingomonas sp.]MDX3885531.1 squalene synthase HpnC [Sphingomonas sp.]